jgi:hypothetical protein
MEKSIGLIVGALLTIVGAVPLALRGDDQPTPRPVLVSKGKQHLVHVLAMGNIQDARRSATLLGEAGLIIVHTSLETGEMKVLARTGTWALPTRKISYGHDRILGISADEERLYVVRWNAEPRMFQPPSSSDPIKGGAYRLDVYWLVDGSLIDNRLLTGKGLPEAAPKETVQRGPLNLAANEVACYGTTLRFQGKKVVKSSEKP